MPKKVTAQTPEMQEKTHGTRTAKEPRKSPGRADERVRPDDESRMGGSAVSHVKRERPAEEGQAPSAKKRSRED